MNLSKANMSKFYSCNLCKAVGKETLMPTDRIGEALMRDHLREHKLREKEARKRERNHTTSEMGTDPTGSPAGEAT